MPEKYISCVRKILGKQKTDKKARKYNPYAVCRVSTGYYGTTHNIGLLKPKK